MCLLVQVALLNQARGLSLAVGLKFLVITLLGLLQRLLVLRGLPFSILLILSQLILLNLTLNRFGNFTAYFRVLPAPLPAEYWASLFTVVATAIVGSLLIPAVTGWTKSKRQTSRLNSFHKQMALAYKDNRPDRRIYRH